MGLEEALGLFENGMDLAKKCRERLEDVETRVSQLLEGDEPNAVAGSEDEDAE